MKHFLSIIVAIVLCSTFLVGCEKDKKPNDTADSILNKEISVQKGYQRLDIGDVSTGRKTEGFGCQVDTHIFKEGNGNNYTEKDWQEWIRRIDEMNLQSIRTQVFPEWFERGNDNDDYNTFDYESANVDFGSIEMQQLYRLLDICEQRNIKVDLSFYGCNRIFSSQDGLIKGSWLANAYQGNWITAPKKVDEHGNSFNGYEEYAEAVYVLLEYLTNQKHYTCIYEYSIYPEPNGAFYNANGKYVDDEFINFYKIVDERLKKEKIDSKFLCSGPGDCNNDPVFYDKYTTALKNVFEKNSSSVYRFNETNTNAEMFEYAKTSVGICDKLSLSWGVCECGSNRFMDPANQSDIDTYDRAIYMARLMINFVNAGCTNMKYWVLNDVWYDGYVMRLGLWKLANETFKAEARPQFYSWSLITKYTDFGSEIYSVVSPDPDICMVAFRLPKGSWSYMIANSSMYSKKVALVSKHSTAQGLMNLYEVSGSTLPTDNHVIKSSKQVQMNECVLNLSLKANSFTVISNKS